jgi:O-antigen/teichoic acid export membrane protein
MTSPTSIFKSAFRSGLAGLANLAVGLIRMKFYSIFLGPTLLGYMGLLNAYAQVFGSCATLGLGSTSTRKIGGLQGDEDTRMGWARAITLFAIGLSAIALITSLLLSGFFASLFTIERHDLYIVSIGIFLQCLVTIVIGCLFGLNRIGAYALLSVAGSVAGTACAMAIIWIYGGDGIAWSVAVLPAASAVTIGGYVLWLTRNAQAKPSFSDPTVRKDLLQQVRLGLPITMLILVQLGSALVIRAWLFAFSSEAENGYFHAAFVLANTISALTVSAFDGDLLRRLSEAHSGSGDVKELMRRQVALVGAFLAALISILIGFTDLAVHVLLSAAFIPAIFALKILAFSEFLRGIAYVYGKVPLAWGRTFMGFGAELAATIILFAAGYALIPSLGAVGAATAFALSRFSLLIFSIAASTASSGVHPSAAELVQITVACALLGLLLWLSSTWPLAGYPTALLIFAGSGAFLWRKRA